MNEDTTQKTPPAFAEALKPHPVRSAEFFYSPMSGVPNHPMFAARQFWERAFCASLASFQNGATPEDELPQSDILASAAFDADCALALWRRRFDP